MHDELKNLFNKEVDRKEFLKYIGAVFLSIIGVTNLMRALTHHAGNIRPAAAPTHGYSTGAYGGVDKKN